jgi:hypothetical protein
VRAQDEGEVDEDEGEVKEDSSQHEAESSESTVSDLKTSVEPSTSVTQPGSCCLRVATKVERASEIWIRKDRPRPVSLSAVVLRGRVQGCRSDPGRLTCPSKRE